MTGKSSSQHWQAAAVLQAVGSWMLRHGVVRCVGTFPDDAALLQPS